MAVKGSMRLILLYSAIILMGIIHFAVGVGICAKYRKYGGTFQQETGLSGYNIFVGICTVAVGILGLVAVLRESVYLSKYISFFIERFRYKTLIYCRSSNGYCCFCLGCSCRGITYCCTSSQ